MIKRIMGKMFQNAMDMNRSNILGMLEEDRDAKLLDLGCDEGTWTLELAKKAGTRECHGLDMVDERLEQARKKGIIVRKGDLNKKLPYKDSSFDCVHANQVIEHLHDTDMFIGEIRRVLKHGGYCIVSTENLSSWCNALSLLLGWQPFSVTNISSQRLGIGNPLAVHREKRLGLKSWSHLRVMTARALKELFHSHNFNVERMTGAGYFPLPAFLGRIDVGHSHFITIKARKGVLP